MNRFFILSIKLILIGFFLSIGFSSFSQTTIWQEDFSGYSGGETTGQDNNLPSGVDWTTLNGASGTFSASVFGYFEANYTSSERVWTSEEIDISSAHYSEIAVDIDFLVNNGAILGFSSGEDYIRCYFKVDGGSEVLFFEHVSSGINVDGTLGASRVITGNTVQIIIKVFTDDVKFLGGHVSDDYYRINDVSVDEVVSLYSRMDGDWDNGNSWSATDFSGSQTACGCFPTSDEVAVIGNSNTISLSSSENAAGLEVQNNGTLNYSGNNTLDISQGLFTVESGGSVDKNGNTANLRINSSYNSILHNDGSVNISNLILPLDDIDLEITGSSDIDISGDIDIEQSDITLTNNSSGTLSDGRIYFDDDRSQIINNGTIVSSDDLLVNNGSDNNNLLTNNSGASLTIDGNIDLSNANFTLNNYGTINQSGIFTVIDGGSNFYNYDGATWNYGGASFDNSTRLFCNNGTNTFNYNNAGAQDIITPQDAYSNLEITGSGPKTAQGDIIVNGDLTLENSALIDFSNNDLDLVGDFTINSNNPNAVQNLNATTITGTSDQTFGGSNNNEYSTGDLVVSQASGTNLILQRPIRITNSLTLNTGIIQSSATNSITFSDNATSNDGNANSYIDGPVVKEGNDAFVFPTGDGGVWAPIGIANLSGGIGTIFTARYHNTSFGASSSIKVINQIFGILQKVSAVEYWNLSNSGSASSTDVTLYWKDADNSGINDFANLMVAHYDGSLWENLGQDNITSGSQGDVTVTGVNNFSPFTFGTTNGNNPLPIELKDFNAEYQDNSVVLDWTTITELNNDYFTLERSTDGINYKEIGEVKGAGTSDVEQDYEFVDDEVMPGKYYYKLKQTDFDGTYEYFDPVFVRVAPGLDDGQISTFNVYPNPMNGSSFYLNYTGLNTVEEVNLEIIDISGRKVFEDKLGYLNNSSELNVEMNRKLDRGIYTVLLISGDQIFKKKILVN